MILENKHKTFVFQYFKAKTLKNEPVVIISEDLNRLDNKDNSKAIQMLGGKLI